ncbi:MAG: hypothetical protein U9R74_17985 [Pseudomonadota bacterium]|nr:hypothetical protein [Pseudomonadota bacterium]
MSTPTTRLILTTRYAAAESLKRILADDFDVNIAEANEAEALPESEWVQIIPRDRRMPDTAGLEFLKPVREQWRAAKWHIVRFDP